MKSYDWGFYSLSVYARAVHSRRLGLLLLPVKLSLHSLLSDKTTQKLHFLHKTH
jgi:hypothetical protein